MARYHHVPSVQIFCLVVSSIDENRQTSSRVCRMTGPFRRIHLATVIEL